MREFPAELTARFRPVRPLGEGGYGAVWLAEQVELARHVAVKVLAPQHARDEQEVARFLDEARVTAALVHPAIVKVLDFGESGGLPWIAYELLEGRTLGERLAEGPLAPLEVARAGAQVARGLVEAHARGVLHRDIKPGNLFQISSGAVKITDFGIAQWGASDRVKTATGVIVGSPAYIAPERVAGEEHTPASDVYALGVTLFELATGGLPFADPSPVLVLEQHLKAPVPRAAGRAPAVPRALDEAIAAAMAKDPKGRPRPEELAERLEALAGGGAQPEASGPPRSRPGPRSRGGATVRVFAEERSAASAPAVPPSRAGGPVPSPRQSAAALVLSALAALAVCAGWLALRPRGAPPPAAPRVRVAELDVYRSARGVLVNAELVTRAALRFEVRDGDEDGRPVVALDAPERVWHQALLDGLEPKRRYTMLIRAKDGARVLAYRFETLASDVEKAMIESLALDQDDFGLAAALDQARARQAFLPPARVAEAVRHSRSFAGGHALRLTVDVLSSWQLEEVARAVLDQLGADPKAWAPLVPLEVLMRRGSGLTPQLVSRWFPREDGLDYHEQRELLVRLHAHAAGRPTPRGLAERAFAARCEASERFARALLQADPEPARALFRTWLERDRTPERRTLAAAGLSALGGEEDVAAVLQALPERDADLTPYLRALSLARTPAVRDALVARAATARPSVDLITALIRHQVTAAVPRIVEWTRRDHPVQVRSSALCALGLLAGGDPAALEEARRQLRDEDPLVARAAAWAVGRARHSPAAAEVERLVDQKDADVHGLAAWALIQLRGRAGAQRVVERTRQLIQALGPDDHLRAGVGYLAAHAVAPDLASALDGELRSHPNLFLKTCQYMVKSARSAGTERSILLFPWVPLERIDEIAGRGTVGDLASWRVLARHKPEGWVHEADRVWLQSTRVLIDTSAHGPERRQIDSCWRTVVSNLDGPLELTGVHRAHFVSSDGAPLGDLAGAVVVGFKHAGRLQ